MAGKMTIWINEDHFLTPPLHRAKPFWPSSPRKMNNCCDLPHHVDSITDTKLNGIAVCTVNKTLDLRNVTSLPFWLVYLPNEWIVYSVIWPILWDCVFYLLCSAPSQEERRNSTAKYGNIKAINYIGYTKYLTWVQIACLHVAYVLQRRAAESNISAQVKQCRPVWQ